MAASYLGCMPSTSIGLVLSCSAQPGYSTTPQTANIEYTVQRMWWTTPHRQALFTWCFHGQFH